MTGTIVTIPLRWGDLDAQGHVNNAMVTEYLQEARAAFLRTTPNSHLPGSGIVVVSNQVEYRSPISFGRGPVEAEVGIVEVGAARFVIAYVLRQQGVEVARARTTLCPFDFGHKYPRRLTQEEREAFREIIAEDVELREVEPVHLHGQGHVHELFVRWGDQDAYGHVNNVRFFDYLQEARIAMTTTADPSMARVGTDSGADVQPDRMWLVVRQDVDHLVQMDHRSEPFAVLTGVAKVGSSSVTLASEIVDPRRERLVLARGRTVLVCADAKGRPVPLPETTREALAAWQV